MVKRKHILTLGLLQLLWLTNAKAQEFDVGPMPINHWERATFCPVWYQGGMVFCGDRHRDNVKSVYYHGTRMETTDIYFVSSTDPEIRLLSEALTTPYSDGPISFARGDSLCFFSRNIKVLSQKGKARKDAINLGIYSAWNLDGKWGYIQPFAYNSDEYSNTHPAISADGTQLCFASNMPGGFGGFDLYFSTLDKTGWSEPINAGSEINSPGNELFPSWAVDNALFFSSDGLVGLGGLDIYHARLEAEEWVVEPMSDPVNSSYDDFGILTNAEMQKGYFSSNRWGNDRLFTFRTNWSKFDNCDTMTSRELCYTFSDENADPVSGSLLYEWDLGDGNKRQGLTITYCYTKPGDYKIQLSIIDTLTDRAVMDKASYELSLKLPDEPIIEGPTLGGVGQPLTFDASNTKLDGMTGKEYYWNFGDCIQGKGENVVHSYQAGGSYDVKMAVTGFENGVKVSKCSFTKLRVYQAAFNYQALVKDSVDFLPEPFPESELAAHLDPSLDDLLEHLAPPLTSAKNEEIRWDADLYYRVDAEKTVGFDFRKLLADSLGLTTEALKDMELLWHYVGTSKAQSFNYEQLLKSGIELARDSQWDPELIFTSPVASSAQFPYRTLDPDAGICEGDTNWTVHMAWKFDPQNSAFDYKKLLREKTLLAKQISGSPELIWSSNGLPAGFNYEKLNANTAASKLVGNEDPALFFRYQDENSIAAFHYDKLTPDRIPLQHMQLMPEPEVTLTAKSFEFKKLPSEVVYLSAKSQVDPHLGMVTSAPDSRIHKNSQVKYRIIIYQSNRKLELDDPLFAQLSEFNLDRCYRADDGSYLYTTGNYEKVEAAYPDYCKVLESGFEDAELQSFEFLDYNGSKTNQILRDLFEVAYFDSSSVILERIRIFRNIEFDSDSYALRHEAKNELDAIGKYLLRHAGIQLDVWAHTDSTASVEHNMRLSSSRAFAVTNYFEKLGVAKHRLFPVAYGESKPIASNETEDGKQMNRRVEFRFREVSDEQSGMKAQLEE